MLETQLHFISTVIIFLAAIVPIYLTIKLKGTLKKLTAILSIFVLIHAVYQVVGFLGFNLLADGVFEPLSAGLLIFFGIVYSGIAKEKKMSVQNMSAVWSPVVILLLMNSITIILLFGAGGEMPPQLVKLFVEPVIQFMIYLQLFQLNNIYIYPCRPVTLRMALRTSPTNKTDKEKIKQSQH